MDDEIKDDELLEGIEEGMEESEETESHSDYKPVNRFDAAAVHHLSGMYQNWFLDYASYTILDRAVPHIEDGLKPVQRRILHSMKRMDDGRFNKVANIVGHTMQFHPHGDASIGDALVQLGQKDLLIDTQGNWGNILTGNKAAAPRYIEARLSKFALDTVFNPKTTEWQMSYDGRNKEPITLPVKFPLLLAQGAEGIAVGLSTKVLPHNFVEICDAAISYLHDQPFQLYPDFPTGGSIDVSKYNDGQRGGVLKVRAKIEKLDPKTLVIREIPFSKTTETLIDSILKAIDKGKIKARHVEDLTAAKVEIQVQLAPGVSSDKTLDALYAFSDCEINISPNCCVIEDNKPQFLTISDVLRHSVDRRIYKDKKFEQAPNVDAVCEHIDERLTPFYPQMIREVTKDDILKLLEIKMQRILKFNKDKADELMARIKAEIDEIDRDLANLVEVTADWFQFLKDKYGKDHPRQTEIRNFDTIEATKVVEANQKLFIIFYKDGKMKVVRVAEKLFVGKNVMWLGVFKKNDQRTIYNAVYRDGKKGTYYIKRFNVSAITRDREYDITNGTPGSKVVYFTANPNGEAEIIKVTLDPAPKLKKIFFDKDFSEVGIKGRAAKGVILTKYQIHRIGLKSHGHSTLGGRKVWYDPDVNRLNYDEHGRLLGEFNDGEQILVILKNGDYYLSGFDVNVHFEDNVVHLEKYDADKVWSCVLFDADNQGYPYVKRFLMEASKKKQNYLGENPNSQQILLTDQVYPRIQINYGGADEFRGAEEVDVEQFIAVKGYKAKGKRLTTYQIESIVELEPTRYPTEPSEPTTPVEEEENLDPDAGKSQQQVLDELTGQQTLFTDEDYQ